MPTAIHSYVSLMLHPPLSCTQAKATRPNIAAPDMLPLESKSLIEKIESISTTFNPYYVCMNE